MAQRRVGSVRLQGKHGVALPTAALCVCPSLWMPEAMLFAAASSQCCRGRVSFLWGSAQSGHQCVFFIVFKGGAPCPVFGPGDFSTLLTYFRND